jgi:hypothetical protein
MIKCPYCHFDNEDGALFCEQCKSDLGGVEPIAAQQVAAPPVAEAIPLAVAEPVETLPFAPVVEVGPAGAMPVAEAVAVPIEEPVPLPPPVAEAIEPLPAALETAPAEPLPAAPEPPPAALEASAPPAAEPAPAPPAAAPAAPAGPALPAGAQPRLVVLRGQKRNAEYPIYEGMNFIGRADEKPVDIDLEDQEPPDRIWSSRQHAVIAFEDNQLAIEDLNSSNGTFVNRARIYPGQRRPLNVNDVIQIGTVQLKVVV